VGCRANFGHLFAAWVILRKDETSHRFRTDSVDCELILKPAAVSQPAAIEFRAVDGCGRLWAVVVDVPASPHGRAMASDGPVTVQ